MTLRVLNCGCAEGFKASIHLATGLLSGLMAAYNFAAWLRRRERHLAVNAALYTAGVVWEAQHTAHHFRQRGPQ